MLKQQKCRGTSADSTRQPQVMYSATRTQQHYTYYTLPVVLVQYTPSIVFVHGSVVAPEMNEFHAASCVESPTQLVPPIAE